MIVSFSGIDSSGKSTQIEFLYNYYIKRNIKVRKIWGKARGTPGVIFVKKLIRKDKNMSIQEKLDYRNQILKSTKNKKILILISILDLCWYFGIYYRILNVFNKILICDRYIWDTYIELKSEFQDIDIDKWIIWKFVILISPKPKESLVFIIPAEESIKRDIQKNDLIVDDLELKNRKISLYMELIKQGKWTTVLNGLKSIEEIHNNVLEVAGLEN